MTPSRSWLIKSDARRSILRFGMRGAQARHGFADASGDLHGAWQGRVWKDESEFLAADPGGHVTWSVHGPGDSDQASVAGRVTIMVIVRSGLRDQRSENPSLCRDR
jgi:hypothetical protein